MTPAKGPHCHCGSPLTHTPGKRPRVYCSDRCRKAAKRAIARGLEESGSKSGHLGKRTTEFRAPSDQGERGGSSEANRGQKADARKSRRYADRRTLWNISTLPTCRGCGRMAMDPDTGVILAQTAEGTALTLGLLACGKIWFCPVCSAKIRHKRAEEITQAVVTWIQQGGTALLVTFTARHAATDQLADLMDAIQGTRADKERGLRRKPGAYQRLITGAAWAGDPRRKANPEGIRGRVGYLGMIRATEVTVGQINGWHPHIHAIVLIGARTAGTGAARELLGTYEPSASSVRELEDHFRGVWTRHLKQVDPSFEPSDKHGVDFKRLETVRDAENFGQYIAKIQDGSKAVSPANELARGDLKEGRYGNMTPFQVLGRIGDLRGGVPEEDADGHGSLEWCLAKWFEYEAALPGRRAIEWTRHLRALLGLDGGDTEEDDMDLLLEADAVSEFRAGVRVETKAWHQIAGRGLDLAAIEAAQGRSLDTSAVVDVVTAAGASATAVWVLSPGEIQDAWDSLLEKLADRRERAAARRRIEEAGTTPHPSVSSAAPGREERLRR